MPKINNPESCQFPNVYRIQLSPMNAPNVRHCSAQQNATNMAIRPVKKAQKKPTFSARKIESGLSKVERCHRLNTCAPIQTPRPTYRGMWSFPTVAGKSANQEPRPPSCKRPRTASAISTLVRIEMIHQVKNRKPVTARSTSKIS